MFNRLKRRFVMINMSLLTLVFAAIFGVIFTLTVISGQRQIDFALHTIMNAPPPAPNNPLSASSIIVDLDKEEHILRIQAYWQIDQSTLEDAVKTMMAGDRDKIKLKLGDMYYAGLKQSSPLGTRIVFVDRTPQHDTQINLLVIFALVGSISLIILFVVSLILADRSIKPIREAFDKQQQFIADASHELKTPLTIIKTNLSLLHDQEEETVKSQAKWIDFIASQTDRLAKLVDDMLSLAKLDFADQEKMIGEFDLSRTIKGELLSFETVAFENKIALAAGIEPDIRLKGDKEAIKRLVGILLDNALKNTPEEGEIKISLENDKNMIRLEVRNPGEGIPKEKLEKIFERFYRVDTARTRERGGYGLGLAIAKSIVEKHKGRIYAQSSPGADTIFVVELPNRA